MLLTRPGWLLHIEGAALLALSVLVFARSGQSWWLFAVLLLSPDIAALGYLANVRVGAALYNLVHIDVWGIGLATYGWLSGHPLFVGLGAIWLAHIGMDRLAGYGLKYPTKFQDTHLQRV